MSDNPRVNTVKIDLTKVDRSKEILLSIEEELELKEIEELQLKCPYSHESIDPEDGCGNCGYGAK